MDPAIRRLRRCALLLITMPIAWFVWAVFVLGGCGKGSEVSTPEPQPAPPPSYQALSDPYATPPSDPYDLPTEPDPRLLEVVHFAFDHHNISDSQVTRLNLLAKNIAAADVFVQIVGHADNRGPATYNELLGLRRAKAVRDYLVREGVEPAKVSAVETAGANNPVDGHDRNRRVEVYLYD
jgi:OmpA-OmpF porin, OOP family